MGQLFIRMKSYPIFQVDVFAKAQFKGNPACVVILDEFLPYDIMLNIAKENAVAETAFIVETENSYLIRWFTPEMEMDLCGHATIAAAYILFNFLKVKIQKITFESLSGELELEKFDNEISLLLPCWEPIKIELPENLKKCIQPQPIEVYKTRDYLFIYDNIEEVQEIIIDRIEFDKIEMGTGGLIVSSESYNYDFVSRYFTPAASVFEDPVTGSAHSTLVPYWSKRLKKDLLYARQISERGGDLKCEKLEDKVKIYANAKLYLQGLISI